MTRKRPTAAIDVSRKEAKTLRKNQKTGLMQSLNSLRPGVLSEAGVSIMNWHT